VGTVRRDNEHVRCAACGQLPWLSSCSNLDRQPLAGSSEYDQFGDRVSSKGMREMLQRKVWLKRRKAASQLAVSSGRSLLGVVANSAVHWL
jgi:hypothetical protein